MSLMPSRLLLNCSRGETPSGTPRGGTPRTNRRSSVMFVDEERSNHGSGLFSGSQTFGALQCPAPKGGLKLTTATDG